MKLTEHTESYQQVDWIEKGLLKALSNAGIETSIVEWASVDSDVATELAVDSTGYPETIAALLDAGWMPLAEAGTYTVVSKMGSEAYVDESGSVIKVPETTGEWSMFVVEAEVRARGTKYGIVSGKVSAAEFNEIIKLVGKLAAGFMLVKYVVSPKMKKTMKMIARNLSSARRRCKYIVDDLDKGICKQKVKLIEAEGELELLTIIYNEECETKGADPKKCAKIKRKYLKKSKKIETKIKQLNKAVDVLEKQQKKEELELKRLKA